MSQNLITQYFTHETTNQNIKQATNQNIKQATNQNIKQATNQNIDQIIIYTDGACKNNGKKNAIAGIGIYVKDKINFSEKLFGKQTNQRAELYAILKAFQLININSYKNIIIVSDSMYSINCITKWSKNWIKNGWKDSNKKSIKNKDLIEPIYSIYNQKTNIIFKHIYSHTDKQDIFSIGNSIADNLAKNALNT